MPVDSRLVGLTKDGRIVGAPADADGYVRIGGAPPMHAYHKRRVAAAGDYAAGDMISNSATAASATAWKLKMGRDAGDAGHITSVWVSASVDSLTTAPHVYLFAREPDRTDTPFTDNAAFAIGARALEYYCGRITLPGLRDDGSVALLSFSYIQCGMKKEVLSTPIKSWATTPHYKHCDTTCDRRSI